jgi:hypothetical protein
MSTIFSIGLVGVSIHTIFVFGVIEASNAPVGQVDEAEIQPGGAAHALEQAEAAAVDVIHRHHVAAGVQQLDHGRAGRHAGSEGEPRVPPSSDATQRS